MGRILIVDDDPDILKVGERVLASAGHIVFVAEDAMRALDYLNTIEFDMLISDAQMPLYNGFELVNTIRNNPKFGDLSIAMLTGLRERRDVEHAMKMGVDDYIVKPLDPLIFLQKIAALFSKRPPKKYPEIHLNDSPLALAQAHIPVRLVTVSELGAHVSSKMPLKAGMLIDVTSEFFRTLDVTPPPMKVMSVEIDPVSGDYKAHLIFLGAREAFLQKIRRWLYSHGASSKAAA